MIKTWVLLHALIGTFVMYPPESLIVEPEGFPQFGEELVDSEFKAYLDYAKEQEEQGSYDLAARALELYSFYSGDSAIQIRMAENFYRMGRRGYERARSYAGSVNLSDDHGIKKRARVVEGLVAFGEGDNPAARVAFAAAVEVDANYAPAALGLAACDIAEGEVISAASRMDALGDHAKHYAVETRYLFRVALQRFAQSKPQVTEEMKPAIEKIARHVGVVVPASK